MNREQLTINKEDKNYIKDINFSCKASNVSGQMFLRGLSLVELLVTIGILAIIGSIAYSGFFVSKDTKTLESFTKRIVADLRSASSRAVAQEESDAWGIHFENPTGEDNDFYWLWHGNDYATGTSISRTSLPQSIRFTDPASGTSKDIVFAKLTGLPDSTADISIESISMGDSRIITINANGRIDF
ncbi:MAG TPA: prepilin-type N-terminal cleavage/methylation domain-containing protein [Candidatus Paceibacterota bacterium]